MAGKEVSCRKCGGDIDRECFKHQYYPEGFSDVILGPYCSKCWVKFFKVFQKEK